MFWFWFKPVSLFLFPKTLKLYTKELSLTGAFCSWETCSGRISDMSHHQQAKKVRQAIKVILCVKSIPTANRSCIPDCPSAHEQGGREDLKMHLPPPCNFFPFATALWIFQFPLPRAAELNTHWCSCTYTHHLREEKKRAVEQLPNNSFYSLGSPDILLLVLCHPAFC